MHDHTNSYPRLTDSSFEALFQVYNAVLKIYAMRFVRQKEAAEDIVHDVFVNIWRHRYRIDMGTIKAYLFTAVRNESLKYLKRIEVRTQYQENMLRKKEVPGSLTWEYYIRAELEEHIEKALQCLSPQQRKIFMMNREEYKTSVEIGLELGLSSRTVEKHMELAINKMRHELAKYLPLSTTTISQVIFAFLLN